MNLAPAVPVVALIYTGGTIGMDGKDDLTPMKETAFLRQLKRSGRFKGKGDETFLIFHPVEQKESQVSRIKVVFTALEKPIDSSLAAPEDWARVATEVDRAEQKGEYGGIVVLHGTDTLAWTASALSFLLGDLRVPVVMTGSQLPLAYSRTDALRNLVSAIEFAASKATPREVCIFFDQVLLRGNRATKVSASGFGSFESRNLDPLGVAGTSRAFRSNIEKLPAVGRADMPAWSKRLNAVCILVLRVHPGMNVFPRLPKKGVALGIVLEAYGSGTADPDHGLKAFLQRAKNRHRAHIVLRTQVPHGAVKEGVYGAADWLTELPVIPGSDITSEACTAKLYYLLAQGLGPAAVKRAMESSLRGEALLPPRGLAGGVLRDISPQDARAADAGQSHYLREGERLGSELRAQLEAAWPNQVSADGQSRDTGIDIVVTIAGKKVGFECTAIRLDTRRAYGAIDLVRRNALDRMIVIANDFSLRTRKDLAKANVTALTWSEALGSTEWKRFLPDLLRLRSPS
ncbi:MAG: asparaginase [Spirochaetaceae bacterium]|nr:asparaginase [Spirochaetaceae bacterium]